MNARSKFEGWLISSAVTVAAVAVFLIVAVFAAPTAVSAQGSTAATGCELLVDPSTQFNAFVPARGELVIPFPPSGARVLCIDGIMANEAAAVEMTSNNVFTATAGTIPVDLAFVGGSIAAGLPITETQQGYPIEFAKNSPIPSIKLVDTSANGVKDTRIFWGVLKTTTTGRPQGSLGSWREFKLGASPTEIAWAKGVPTEIRVRASQPMTLTVAGGDSFVVPALGTPTCTRLGCALTVVGFSGDQTFKVTPSNGGWVSVEASGLPGSKLELWVPSGTPQALAAVTATKVDPKGGGGFPATYLPLMRK